MNTGLVDRLRPRIEGTGIWLTAGPDEDMQALADELTALTAKVALLTEALKFYRDEFRPKIGKPIPGASSITFHPSEALLEDCGNRAMAALSEPDKE